MESDFGLPDGFAWLHELLRNAFSEQEGTRYSSSLAEATKSIRKLDVRPFPGRGSGRFCLAHMGGHATSRVAHFPGDRQSCAKYSFSLGCRYCRMCGWGPQSNRPIIRGVLRTCAEYLLRSGLFPSNRFWDRWESSTLAQSNGRLWGESSGPDARPMQSEWVEGIQVQCEEQDVAFFFKQWGGLNKKAAGRRYRGRVWNNFPAIHRSDWLS